MSIFLYAIPIAGVSAHLLLGFEYGCRHLDTQGYTQSTNTHGRAWLYAQMSLFGLARWRSALTCIQ